MALANVLQAGAVGMILVVLVGSSAAAPRFHFGPGVGLPPGSMGDPQLYWDAPTQRFHIQPQYAPSAPTPYAASPAACHAHAPMGWGHATSTDLIGDFTALPATFGPCAISPRLDEYTSAGTGCTLRLNATAVGSLVNGDTTTGWETTNNYAAVARSDADPVLVNWTQVSHGIEGNHTAGESGWIGTPGNHIPTGFGLIGNVVMFHNSSAAPDAAVVAVVSTSVGDPRLPTSRPAFLLYATSAADFGGPWRYLHPLYVHPTAMNRAECGDLYPIGPGARGVTAEGVDFGRAAPDAAWVLSWSRPARNGGGLSRAAGVVYYVGSMNDAGQFVAATPLQAVDYGAAFYAAQSVLGPGGERLVMGNLGGGVQSLPRAVTLNADRSLNFQPCAALARHRVGAPLVRRNVTAPWTLPLAPSALSALDLTVTVRGAAETTASSSSGGLPGVSVAGLVLTVAFDASMTTGDGTLAQPMRTLHIDGGSGGFVGSIPIAGSLVSGATFRVVIDDHIAEVFGGATPASFSFAFDGAAGAALIMGDGNAGSGCTDGNCDSPAFLFDVEAHQVAPASVNERYSMLDARYQ